MSLYSVLSKPRGSFSLAGTHRNIVSCLVRYGDIALPVGYETVKKDVVYSDIATRKQKRKSQISKNDMFRSLIQQAVSNHVLFDYVLADNWFGSKANMTFIHQDLKKHFIIGIKSNRCVSPYITEQIKRFGEYALDLARHPENLHATRDKFLFKVKNEELKSAA